MKVRKLLRAQNLTKYSAMQAVIATDLKKHLDSIIQNNLLVNDILTHLSEAFYSCDIKIFKKVLKLGLNPNLPLAGNYTPLTYLMSSATTGHWTEVARLLILSGASPNVKDPKGVPFVYSLISAGETELLSFCVDHGASLDVTGVNGESLVIAAVHYKQLDCLRFILRKGIDPNVRDKDGNTAAMWAAGRSNGLGMQISLSCLKALTEYGGDVNVCNNSGFTPLMAASLINEYEAVKVILKAGAVIGKTDKKGETALFKAVDANAEGIVQILIKAGADINATNKFGQTPAMRASSLEVLEMLVLAGVETNKRDQTGRTVLHYKAEEDRSEMVKLLVEYGAPLDARTSNGETPLQLSIRKRSYRSAAILLNGGSPCCSSNDDGVGVVHDLLLPWDYFSASDLFSKLNTRVLWRELLFYTADYRPYTHRILSRLVLTAENVNQRTKEGITPVMLASGCGDLWAVKCLVSAGADPLILDNGGRSALCYGAKSGNDSLVRLLLHLGCDPNSEDKSKNLPLYYAAYFNNDDIMLTLMVEFAFYYCSVKTTVG